MSLLIRLHRLLLPLSLAGSLVAQPAPSSFTFEPDVPVPMRDGTVLAANLFLPNTDGPFPVILMRTPYGKPGESWGEGKRYADAGYALVAQDCRGRGASQGEWNPFRYDVADGEDTLAWVTKQPWCNGNIGTSGGPTWAGRNGLWLRARDLP